MNDGNDKTKRNDKSIDNVTKTEQAATIVFGAKPSDSLERQSKENIHAGHRERLRDAARRDIRLNGFRNTELLELVLSCLIPQRDTNPIAHALLDRFGSVLGVLKAETHELADISGLTKNAAKVLPHFLSLCLWRNKTPVILKNPLDAAEYFGSIYLGDGMNGIYVVCIDSFGRVLGTERCDENGKLNARIIFDAVCKHNTRGVFLIRRYGYGQADIPELTAKLTRIADMLNEIGVKLLDFMTFTDYGYYTLGAPLDIRNGMTEYVFVPHKNLTNVSALSEILDRLDKNNDL